MNVRSFHIILANQILQVNFHQLRIDIK